MQLEPRPSPQIRPVWPEGYDAPHPRCIELAEAMREGDTTFRELSARGFTAAEIAEYHELASRIAGERSVFQLSPRPDLVPDIVDKALAHVPNRPPLPRGTAQTQAVLVAWSRYCTARAAFSIDRWAGQRERCLLILSAYLDSLPIFATVRAEILRQVDARLPEAA